MNEKLKELAEQAQKIVGYTDGGYTEIKALDQEKFASLIIEECSEYLRTNGAAFLVQGLKERFGVEE